MRKSSKRLLTWKAQAAFNRHCSRALRQGQGRSQEGSERVHRLVVIALKDQPIANLSLCHNGRDRGFLFGVFAKWCPEEDCFMLIKHLILNIKNGA